MKSDEAIIQQGRQAQEFKNNPFYIKITQDVQAYLVTRILEARDKDEREQWAQRRKGMMTFMEHVDGYINMAKTIEAKNIKGSNV